MTHQEFYELFVKIEKGALTSKQALQEMEHYSFQDLGFAKVDHERFRRKGFPEVVFGKNKKKAHLLSICTAHLQVHQELLVTRLSPKKWNYLKKNGIEGHYNKIGKILSITNQARSKTGDIVILTAGTSDISVAEEAYESASWMGNRVEVIADVGVAGLQRLLSHLDRLRQAKVIIVIAGMDGALASVVGGLVQVPVIAVPTSIGYGVALKGLSALMTMLNSCAPGVTVVNIDNGFGAAYVASLINNPMKFKG
ncbi:nickel pincer cofactor biosynthesis protein LarB [Deltaproteobacteria bacterium TL4]